MNKRTIKLIIIIAVIFAVLGGLIAVFKNIKVDEFHPASVIFVVDASASNQAKLDEQKKFVKQICNRLDPEDKIKIIRVSEDAYLIFEGSPHNSKNITDSMNEFTKYNSQEWGTAYGSGLNKAIGYCETMYKNGYNPSIVVVGDLENEGAVSKQINWSDLSAKIKKLKGDIPEFAMFFAYAHPQKLDVVKSKLSPILGENHLVISTEQTVDKAINQFLNVISR